MNKMHLVYKYGSPANNFWACLSLNQDGSIYGYNHPNEIQWFIQENKFHFLSENNEITSVFDVSAVNHTMLGHPTETLYPLCLIPILDMTDLEWTNEKSYKFFINTVPKSGTYFFEKALKEMGFKQSRLHLSPFFVDDYRLVPEADIHKYPEKVRIDNIPADIIIKALPLGNISVGHVDHADILNKISNQPDVISLSVIRDLRDILVSLYNFKLHKVKSKSIEDDLWKKISNENDRFYAFLSFYANTDLIHIKNTFSIMINNEKSILVKYEDMEKGVLSVKASEYIDSFEVGLTKKIQDSLLLNNRADSPTLSQKRANWRSYWSDDIQDFFEKFGFSALNIQAGYV